MSEERTVCIGPVIIAKPKTIMAAIEACKNYCTRERVAFAAKASIPNANMQYNAKVILPKLKRLLEQRQVDELAQRASQRQRYASTIPCSVGDSSQY